MVGHDRPVVLAPRQAPHFAGRLAEMAAEKGFVGTRELADGGDADALQQLGGFLARPPQAADGHGPQERRHFLRPDHDQPVGLFPVGGQLGQEFVGGDTGRGGEMQFVFDPILDSGGDRDRVGVQPLHPGDVEERLVERQRLDERREGGQDVPDLHGNPGVFFMVPRYEDALGAEPPRLAHRHGRMDAVAAGFVRGGGNDAPPADAADDDRPAH